VLTEPKSDLINTSQVRDTKTIATKRRILSGVRPATPL
jgi:hypothetical protein